MALSIRCLDYPHVSHVLATLGFRGDIYRPLFPAFCIFILWIVTQVIRSRRKPEWRRPTRILSWLLLASLAMAIVTILNTQDVDLSNWRTDFGFAAPPATVSTVRDWTWRILLLVLGLGLIPFLWRDDLIRSGVSHRRSTPWIRWIPKIAGWSMIAGVPLLIFGCVVREDVFRLYRSDPERNVLLSRAHFRNWGEFWSQVVQQPNEPSGPALRLLKAAADNAPDAAKAAAVTTVKDLDLTSVLESIRLDEQLKTLDRETWTYDRWLRCILAPVPMWRAPFNELLYTRCHLADLQDKIVRRLNERLLGDPDFYEAFAVTQVRNDLAREAAGVGRVLRDSVQSSGADAVNLTPGSGPDDQSPPLRRFHGWQTKLAGKEQSLAQARETLAIARERNEPVHAIEQQILTLTQDTERLRFLGQKLREKNRALLEVEYGSNDLRSRDTVFALVVLDEDQRTRATIGAFALVAFVVLGFFVDINQTSAHRYYRDRLADMWVYRDRRVGSTVAIQELLENTTKRGAPYHIMNATVNLVGPGHRVYKEPTRRFIFSPLYCGSGQVDYEATAEFNGGMTLADAMAISGAAVSPLAVANNPLLFYSMLLVNARLGQWVPRPGRKLGMRPAFIPALYNFFLRGPSDSKYLYLSDGGHHDNTGIETLLVRRCRIIIACDATDDPQLALSDLHRLQRRMKDTMGIQLQFLPDWKTVRRALGPAQERAKPAVSKTNCLVARITYPEFEEKNLKQSVGYLVYLKTTLTGDEPSYVLDYRKVNSSFPHDPTLDQFYESVRFKAYRELGYHLGLSLVEKLPRNPSEAWRVQEAVEAYCNPDRQTEPPPADDDREFEAAIAQVTDSDWRQVCHAIIQIESNSAWKEKHWARIEEVLKSVKVSPADDLAGWVLHQASFGAKTATTDAAVTSPEPSEPAIAATPNDTLTATVGTPPDCPPNPSAGGDTNVTPSAETPEPPAADQSDPPTQDKPPETGTQT